MEEKKKRSQENPRGQFWAEANQVYGRKWAFPKDTGSCHDGTCPGLSSPTGSTGKGWADKGETARRLQRC